MNDVSTTKYGSGILRKRILILAMLAALALVLVACSDSGDEATVPVSSEVPPEQAEFGQYGVCYQPTETVRSGLARTLIRDDLGMRAFFMVRQPYDSISWTIAADIEGPGLEGEGPIALFDALGQTVPEIFTTNVQPFNVVTLEYTDLDTSLGRDIEVLGDVFASLYEENRVGIELLQDCLSEELTTNPDTKIYR